MADAVVTPTNSLVVDDRAGNSYIIFDVSHTSGNDTRVVVPDSAVSVAELPGTHAIQTLNAVAGSATSEVAVTTNQMAVGNNTSLAATTTGLGFAFQTDDGVKQVHIDTLSTTGTYKLVVRCIGNAAGSGSTGAAGL